MSGRFLEDDGAARRQASLGDTIDDGSAAANGSGSEDAKSHGALRRPRNDPAGRRSLTGYEFRQRRSR